MAIARKCDRCGELYECYEDAEFNSIVLVRDRKYTNSIRVREYDLCLACATMLKDWLDVKGEKNEKY
jgi:hypothetical protein